MALVWDPSRGVLFEEGEVAGAEEVYYDVAAPDCLVFSCSREVSHDDGIIRIGAEQGVKVGPVPCWATNDWGDVIVDDV